MPRVRTKAPRSAKQKEQYAEMASHRHDKENMPPPSKRTRAAKKSKKSSAPLQRPPQSNPADLELIKGLKDDLNNMTRRYQNERRKNLRYRQKNKLLTEQLRKLKPELSAARKSLDAAATSAARKDQIHAMDMARLQSQMKLYQKTIRALNARVARVPQRIEKALEKAKKTPTLFRLKHKGIVTPKVRAIARTLVKSGVGRGKVCKIIQTMGGFFGCTVLDKISRRSVSKAVLEGGVQAKVQMGFELGQSRGHTVSADSTSQRNRNIEARHVAVITEDYDSADPKGAPLDYSKTPSVRLLTVDATVDHTSATSMAGWKRNLLEIDEIYNNSPLAKRTGIKFSMSEFAKKLKGMNGDHAANEKRTAKAMQAWKREESLLGLGTQSLLEMDIVEVLELLVQCKQRKIEELGGTEVWNSLSPEAQLKHDAALMNELKATLGEEMYAEMPEQEKRVLDLFLWAGCCMHKDLNSFKGGNTRMMMYWEIMKIVGPVLLANKFNASLLQKILDPAKAKDGPLDDTELAALEASTRGGVKTAAIAGAIFNNKDDKKGQGDTYLWHFKSWYGPNVRSFPQTNNTRFGSYGEAACELLVHLDGYIKFLKLVKYKKVKPGWTNMELNLAHALECKQTREELAVLALYTQSVTHPYMRVVRGPGTEKTNALDLGPFHVTVENFVRKIIDEPHLLLTPGPDAYLLGSVDGKPWERPEAVTAVHDRLGEMPNLKPLLVMFFEGALATWIRFTAEFAPGGLIDTSSAEERHLAWMPSTNDANEGALGSYRLAKAKRPSLTEHQYIAMAMYYRNNTEAFVAKYFEEEDHTYTWQLTRQYDASGVEAEKRKEQVEADKLKVQEQREKEEARVQKEADAKERRSLVVLVTSLADVDGLTVAKLDEQLDVLRQNDQMVPLKSKCGNKKEKGDKLKEALQRYWDARKSSGVDVMDPEAVESPGEVVLRDWAEEEEMEEE